MNTRVLKVMAVVAIMAGLFYVSTSHMTKAQKDTVSENAAASETGKLVIVDIQRVLADSKAGQHIQKQLKEKQAKIDADANKMDAELKAKKSEIEKKQGDMKKEALIAEANKFQQDIMKARQTLAEESNELKQSANQAVQKLRLEIVKVVSEMATENGYALVMTKQNVILAQKEMDITDEVLKALDKSITSVKLEAATNN